MKLCMPCLKNKPKSYSNREFPMNSKIERENPTEKCALLFAIASGRKDFKFASNVLAQEVLIDMDGHRFSGIESWKTWIHFLRSRRWISDVEVISNHMRVDGDWIVVSANWQGIRRGRQVVSNECIASFKISGRHITEIRTKRVNYAFFFTNAIKYRFVFIMILFYVWVWKHLLITKL